MRSAVRYPGELARASPAGRAGVGGVLLGEHAREAGGQRVDVRRRGVDGALARDLAQHGDVGGEHRPAGSERLEGGRRSPRRSRAARAPGRRRRGPAARRPSASPSRGPRPPRPGPPPGRRDRRARGRGGPVLGAQRGMGLHEPVQVLAGVARADEDEVLVRQAARPSHADVAGAASNQGASTPRCVALTCDAGNPYCSRTAAATTSVGVSTCAPRARARGTSPGTAGWRRSRSRVHARTSGRAP